MKHFVILEDQICGAQKFEEAVHFSVDANQGHILAAAVHFVLFVFITCVTTLQGLHVKFAM